MNEMIEKKELIGLIKKTEELKELIKENPDLPIVVLVDSDVVADDSYAAWFAPDVRFHIGQILSVENHIVEDRTFTDRDDFEDEVILFVDDAYPGLSQEEQDEQVQRIMKEYEPYWKKCICIHATT